MLSHEEAGNSREFGNFLGNLDPGTVPIHSRAPQHHLALGVSSYSSNKLEFLLERFVCEFPSYPLFSALY
jgi:hypothetical protein